MIDLKSDDGFQREISGVTLQILVGNVAAHHNGAVITCDSAVRHSDARLECFGNVLINKGTTYIYGDRADYDREKDEARVYSEIVKVVDRGATLYTYNFKFNTATNIGEYYGGGVVMDEDNLLESERGYYYSDPKDIICVENVQMRNDTYEMTGDSVIYNVETNRAQFFENTNIWNEGEKEYLYADRGSFDRDSQRYSLTLNGYVLTDEQELWSDTLDYYRNDGYVRLKRNIQLDDRTQKMMAFGDWGEYWKEPGDVFLTKDPSVISYDLSQGDSVFMRSDSMFLYTKDPVRERLEREKAEAEAKEAAERAAAEEEAKPKEHTTAPTAGKQTEVRTADGSGVAGTDGRKENAGPSDDLRRKADKASDAARRGADARRGRSGEHKADAKSDSVAKTDAADSPAAAVTDSLPADTLQADSLKTDSLAVAAADTLTKAQRRALLKEQAKKERAEQKKIKAEALRKKLDEIADRRQAKRTAQLRRMEAADSARRAKAQLRADERLRKSLAKMAKKGIKVAPADSTVMAGIDSMFAAELMQQDSSVNRMLDSLLAIYFPKIETDTLAADTLAVDSTYRLLLGYRNVRMFRSDFQSVCDSLTFSTVDSVIHMYISPVLWNDNNQITSEIMHVITQNQQVVRADFEGKPLTVAEIDTLHYNQVAGKEMSAHFRDNQIYRNDVNGNVQTIYYMEENNPPEITMMAYIESADMTSYIEDRRIVGITYCGNPTYIFYPMDKIPESQPLFLQGFSWEKDRRPTKEDVFKRKIRESLREVKEALEKPAFPINDALDRRKERLIRRKAWSDRTDTLSVETLEWLESLSSDY
ncbi:MAG: hypothetical protein J6J75_04025 [Alistipes sp.]|nr:hypothetical protein [Alistipes sp.]